MGRPHGSKSRRETVVTKKRKAADLRGTVSAKTLRSTSFKRAECLKSELHDGEDDEDDAAKKLIDQVILNRRLPIINKGDAAFVDIMHKYFIVLRQ